MTNLLRKLLVAALLLLLSGQFLTAPKMVRAAGSISLAALGTPYTQNFDTLANTGTSPTTPLGWGLSEAGTNADTTYAAGDGTGNGGNTYSFGSVGSTERAFGGLQSGALIPTIGAAFTNNTGSPITSLAIAYTGEEWRLGTAGRTDQIVFQYSTDATSLTTGTWNNAASLNFNTPDTATTGAKNGDLAADRTSISATISGLNLANGAGFWIRWTDTNATGADDGLAVDDFSLTPSGAAVLPNLSISDVSQLEGNTGTTTMTFTVSLSIPAPVGEVTFDIATQDNTATIANNDYVARSLTSQTIPAASSTYTFGVTINGDTVNEPNETFNVNVTNVTGATVIDGQGVGTLLNDDAGLRIHDIQGSAHISPYKGQNVTGVPGIVTGELGNGFFMQDPVPDADDRTSEGIFVFTGGKPTVAVGDSLLVSGNVSEFRPGGASGAGNLTTTEIGSPSITLLSSGNALPAAVIAGTGGRVPPNTIIEDDAGCGDVELCGTFDPATDGIDYWESLEGMRVQLNNAVIVGPTNAFGETQVLGDNGSNAVTRTPRGGVIISQTNFNPEIITIDDEIYKGIGLTMPPMNVADTLPGTVTGIMTYNFGEPMLELTAAISPTSGGLTQEQTTPQTTDQLAIATFNVENLNPADPASKFTKLGTLVVNNLKSPDIVAIEEVQDNNGPTDNGTVAADTTWNLLINAISTAGGPVYQYVEIDPVNDQDGGQPGGNIRQGFLYNPLRVTFISRPGATSTTANAVVCTNGQAQLQFSPGRIAPGDTAWATSRKPLAAEFTFQGQHFIMVGNHFDAKLGDTPLFGHIQPPTLSSATQRVNQATVENTFLSQILNCQSDANIVTLGDLNDYPWSTPVKTLAGTILDNLMNTLPTNEQYSYVFDGNSQVLDQALVSHHLTTAASPQYDVVHINAEFFNDLLPGSVRASDHDPSVARFAFNAPTATALPANAAPQVNIADPAISKAADISLALKGDTVTFTLTVTNAGSLPAPGIVVTDPVAAPLLVVSAAAQQGTYTQTGNTVVFNVGTVNPGQVINLKVVTKVGSSANPPLAVVNTATLTWPNGTARSSAASLRITQGTLPLTGEHPAQTPIPAALLALFGVGILGALRLVIRARTR